mgnify:CR=1 FL=1
MAAVERWLVEARVARDTVRFALPKSRLSIGAGDVVRISGGRYRVDRVEQAESQLLETIRVEPGLYLPSERSEEIVSLRPFTSPVPVVPVFLDLPALRCRISFSLSFFVINEDDCRVTKIVKLKFNLR